VTTLETTDPRYSAPGDNRAHLYRGPIPKGPNQRTPRHVTWCGIVLAEWHETDPDTNPTPCRECDTARDTRDRIATELDQARALLPRTQ
jgi:hypothetical protein